MNVKIQGVSVCEFSLARAMLYLAGCGQRRVDGDTLHVFPEFGPLGFYVPEGTQQAMWSLVVDEGSYTNALHGFMGQKPVTQAPTEETERCFSLPWCEYVDMGDLMRVLVRKLVGDVKYESGPYIGRGKNQRHEMDQSIAHLRKWSSENPDHPLKFQ